MSSKISIKDETKAKVYCVRQKQVDRRKVQVQSTTDAKSKSRVTTDAKSKS